MLHRNTTDSHAAEFGAAGASAAVPQEASVDLARLQSIAAVIELRGIAGDPSGVESVAVAARGLGVSPVLVSVLIDDAEPSVARERAFGRISAIIDSRLRNFDVSRAHDLVAC